MPSTLGSLLRRFLATPANRLPHVAASCTLPSSVQLKTAGKTVHSKLITLSRLRCRPHDHAHACNNTTLQLMELQTCFMLMAPQAVTAHLTGHTATALCVLQHPTPAAPSKHQGTSASRHSRLHPIALQPLVASVGGYTRRIAGMQP